jgi:F-type H+-transporting ATPase subunit epsilon
MLHVVVTSPERLVFDGPARSIIFPGDQGTFEVLPLHRPLISRLRRGLIEINDAVLAIRHGIVRVADDEVTVIVELD